MSVAAEFRVLGPLEASVAGQLVDVGHTRQRGVLALLLIGVGRLVTLDSMVQRLWGVDAPASATSLVYSYVSRLRRQLAPAGSVQLLRRSGGYTLDADPDCIDLHRFRRLAAEARLADDDTHASALLDEGLQLWRGRAFTNVASTWLDEMRVTLDLERMAAVLHRAEVELRLGVPGKVLGDLRPLLAANPLDERLAGEVMRAAYQSGQRVAALRCYAHLRQAIADELGAEPSLQTQELFQQILRDDPGLRSSTPALGHGTRPVPAQLPHDVAGFTGRRGQLESLRSLFSAQPGPGSRAVVISAVDGAAGVGKTALAIHFAHLAAGQFPDGQLYANLRGYDGGGSPRDPGDLLSQFLRALSVSPQRIPGDLAELSALYRTTLAGRRMLIVLDNARTSEQVRPLLPGNPACPVLITSRDRLDGLIAGDGAYRIALDVLTASESQDLLASIIGADRVAAEPDNATELARLCGHLPLALRIAAERIVVRQHATLSDLVSALAAESHRLQLLSTAEEASAVQTAFSWSYHALPVQAGRMFRLLGLHRGPDISLPAAAALAGTGAAETAALLATLTGRHLVEEHSAGRYTLHDLIRLYATERAAAEDRSGARETAIARLLSWYLHSADAACGVLNPLRRRVRLEPPIAAALAFASHADALGWCDTERQNLLAAARQALESGHEHVAARLPLVLWDYHHLRKPWTEWLSGHQVGLRAARLSHDRTAESANLIGLGIATGDLRRFSESIEYLQQALAACRARDKQWGQAICLNGLGAAYRDSGRPGIAMRQLRESLGIWRQLGDTWGEAIALQNLADAERHLRCFDQAIEHFQRALKLRRDIGDQYGTAWTLHDIGATEMDQGLVQEAIGHLGQALAVRREIGDLHGEARTLRRLAGAFRAAGQSSAADDAWLQALQIFEDLDDPRAGEMRAHPEEFGGTRRPGKGRGRQGSRRDGPALAADRTKAAI